MNEAARLEWHPVAPDWAGPSPWRVVPALVLPERGAIRFQHLLVLCAPPVGTLQHTLPPAAQEPMAKTTSEPATPPSTLDGLKQDLEFLVVSTDGRQVPLGLHQQGKLLFPLTLLAPVTL